MDDKKHNSFCAICGKSYYYCNSCKDTAHLYPYKILTDTSEHYKVFMIIRGYSNGLYTKEETEQKLNNVDISDLETYKENIRDKEAKIEVAFFGGSFTGIDEQKQEEFLQVAYEYVKQGEIHSIRISTRPDYIDKKVFS